MKKGGKVKKSKGEMVKRWLRLWKGEKVKEWKSEKITSLLKGEGVKKEMVKRRLSLRKGEKTKR